MAPAGARVGSNRLAWTSSTNGRSGRTRRDLRLRSGDLLERAAEVDRRRLARLRRSPRDRPVEREVELEDARAVAVALEPAPVRRGRRSPAIPRAPGRRRVEHRDACSRQVVQPRRRAGRSRPARRARGAPRRAPPRSARRRPRGTASRRDVRRRRARARPRRSPARQPEDRVRGDAREQGPRARRPGTAARPASPAGAREAEPRHAQRADRRQRDVERREEVGHERVRVVDEPAEQPPVGVAVAPSPAAVSSTSPRSMTAGPSSSGWPSAAGGSIQRRPWPASAAACSAKNGDVRPNGWTALQTSWTNPGQRELARTACRRPARRPPPGPSRRGRPWRA